MPDAPKPDDAARLSWINREKEEAEPGLVRSGRRGNGPPGVAGTHYCHLCGLLPSTHCKLTFDLSTLTLCVTPSSTLMIVALRFYLIAIFLTDVVIAICFAISFCEVKLQLSILSSVQHTL